MAGCTAPRKHGYGQHVRGIEFQQGVWRYHPVTRNFELFCEGGGNSWGVDFDAQGELLYSTNFGGYVMLHGVQGAYYWKNFGKHGALHNPYSFGYFDHVPHANFTGGHVTDGGIVYQADLFPPEFRGRYVAADLLGHAVHWHTLSPARFDVQLRPWWHAASRQRYLVRPERCHGWPGRRRLRRRLARRPHRPSRPRRRMGSSNGRIYRIQPRGARRKPAARSTGRR